MAHFSFPVTVSIACKAPSAVPISTRLSAVELAAAAAADAAAAAANDEDEDCGDDDDDDDRGVFVSFSNREETPLLETTSGALFSDEAVRACFAPSTTARGCWAAIVGWSNSSSSTFVSATSTSTRRESARLWVGFACAECFALLLVRALLVRAVVVVFVVVVDAVVVVVVVVVVAVLVRRGGVDDVGDRVRRGGVAVGARVLASPSTPARPVLALALALTILTSMGDAAGVGATDASAPSTTILL
jgi:hypothetical protein